MKVEQNIARIKHLLRLYNFEVSDFLRKISIGLKNPISESELFAPNIKLSYLKRIDKIFAKGLHYYLDPKTPTEDKESSIFFRKQSFNTELNLGARKVVNQFEEFKISLTAIAKLSDLEYSRKFPIFSIKQDPEIVAKQIREVLYPLFNRDLKEFLKDLISILAENNILVFEFVEYWNQKEKANIDGFYLKPNVIVLKRQQSSFRREIFTLVHELGHFLLEEEEIEELDILSLGKLDLPAIERWCNDFTFYFLAGNYSEVIDQIEVVDDSNDYQFELIESVSKETHLSQIALFTKLLLEKKISNADYQNVRQGFEERYRAREKKKERQKEKGIQSRGSAPQPIKSPLLISTIQAAFYEGILSEYEVCKRLNIKPEKFDKYIE